MLTALREIRALRGDRPLTVDPRNGNRYRVLIQEAMGTTAYCFSTPVYNTDSRKLVCRRFEASGEALLFTGSNATVTAYKSQIVLKNAEGSACIPLPLKNLTLQGDGLCAEGWEIKPTFNGVLVNVRRPSLKLTMSTDKPFGGVRSSTKSLAIMKEEFRPFLTVSSLWSTNQGRVFPTEMTSRSLDERTYEVELLARGGEALSFEINLYEPKLFQDTTVENLHADENNAFGGLAFLGRTAWHGEQWLYSRPDFSKIPELYAVRVKKVLLHLPCLYSTGAALAIGVPAARFCSFGSTWNNKIGQTGPLAAVHTNGKWATVELSHVLTHPAEQRLRYTEGFILRPQGEGEGFTAVATGDNYAFPPILEVQYI